MIPEIADFLLPFARRERTLLILGAGLTGTSLADLFTRYRIPFSLYDRDLSSLTEKISGWKPCLEAVWDQDSFPGEEGGFTDILLSPGFPRRERIVAALEKRGRVWNDVDFFAPLLTSKTLIAITGTDGKSTTVELIRHLLGKEALACGNNDVPLASVLERILSPEILQVVIEFSSFMLERVYRFRAHYNAILNLTPDHLDRYDSFSDYAFVKHNILRHVLPSDVYLHNTDDPETKPRNPIPRVITYGTAGHPEYFLRDRVYFHNQGDREIAILDGDLARFSAALFPGNIFPALILARECGVAPDLITNRVRDFPGLPHRLERVPARNRQREEIFVYNNSKATTLQSVIASINYLHTHHHQPVHIIFGGKSKNTDFRPLSLYREKIRRAYFYGEAGKLIREQLGVQGKYAYSLGEIIDVALREIPPGEVLILSPGCASFDQFHNYRERGDFFKDRVKNF